MALGSPPTYRVLLVEDEKADTAWELRALEDDPTARFETHVARTLEQALRALEQDTFDVILLDLMLPDAQHLEGLERILSLRAPPPVVIATALDNARLAIRAVRRGASDYLVKDPDRAPWLPLTLRHAVVQRRQQDMLASTHGAFGGERHEVIRAQIAQASAALAMARTLAAQLGSLRRDPAVRDHPRMAEELDRAVETVASMIEHLQRIESPFRRRSQG